MAGPGCLAICVLICCFYLPQTFSFPNGAPPYETCYYMQPKHLHPHTNRRVHAQGGIAPFNITVDKTTYHPDTPIRVTIHAHYHTPFKGFMLVAGEEGSAEWPTGIFYSETKAAKTLYCAERADAITQTNSRQKTQLTVIWYGPQNAAVEMIQFVATIVTNNTHYWVNVKSPILSPDPTLPEVEVEELAPRGEGGAVATHPPHDRWALSPWSAGSPRRGGRVNSLPWYDNLYWNPFLYW